MSRVLITGATGFIGTHLVRRLRESGDEIVCLVRGTSNRAAIEGSGVEFVIGDLNDFDTLSRAVQGCEVVYHLAGLTAAFQASDLHRVNGGGSLNVAKACAEQPNPPVLVHVSSIAAAGPSVLGRPRVESDEPRPVSHYGRSKLASEHSVRTFADRVPITIVRPPIVFGEGDRSSLPVFMSVQRFGIHLSPLWRSQPFSFIHAGDLSSALVAAARSGRRLVVNEENAIGPSTRDASTGVYFAAADEVITYAEFGRRIGQALGVARTSVIPNLAPAVWMAALGSELVARVRRRPLIFNLDKAREAVAGSWACSSESLARDTAWRPANTLDERLEQTAQWYREQGWLPKPGLLVKLARR
jgi:nucleoside-diphosphate-sugar epimerase